MTPAMILGVCGSDSRYMAVPVKASMISIAVKPDNLMPSKFFSCVFIMIIIDIILISQIRQSSGHMQINYELFMSRYIKYSIALST